MVLLIPDAVRKIKAQGRAEGYAQGRQEARQRIRAALLEYRRRQGMGLRDPIPVSEIRKVIDGIDFNDTARSA